MRVVRALAGTACLLLLPTTAAAQVVFGGQVRPRFEIRDPVLGLQDRSSNFTSMRTRAQLIAELESNVTVFVQVQDVRLWGEESSPLGDFDADQFDLHQGWVELANDAGDFALRVGRQEAILAEERLVGAVGWAQQAQSFDGLRATWSSGALELDALAFQIGEAEASGGADRGFFGLYGALDLEEGRVLDLYGFYDREGIDDEGTDQFTFGTRYAARSGDVSYRVEAALQVGERDGTDVSANMITGRVTFHVADDDGSITFWYDRLSGGDGAPGDDEDAFSTLFATGHKFYGFADLFLNVPRDTGGRGLQDLAVKGSWRLADDVTLAADVHHFRVVEDLGLGGELANEVDLTLRWSYAPGVTFQGGLSYISDGEQLRSLGRLDKDQIWTYAMLTASF